LESIMRSGSRAEFGGIECLPLAASSQDEEYRVHANAIGRPGTAATKAMRVPVARQDVFDLGPEFVRDTPVVGDG
jgi:hypothetical protein